MVELELMFKKYLRILLLLLAFYVLGIGFSPYKVPFQSLALGTLVGIFLLRSMVTKSIQLGDAVVSGKKMRSIGMLTRMGAAAIATMIVAKYPANFSIVFLVIGLMTIYVIVFIGWSLSVIKEK